MPDYRRAREGNTYFFTVVTYQRQPILCCEKSRALLREIITKVRNSHPFIIEAWVLLPDHIHWVVNAPKDWSYSTFRRYVEAGVYSPDWGATPLQIPTDIGGE
jgi:putative transposase